MVPEPFEAREMVEDVCAEHREAAEAKGLKLVVNVPAEHIFVIADSSRVAQILNNLVSNAVKYTAKGNVVVSLEPYDQAKGALHFDVI